MQLIPGAEPWSYDGTTSLGALCVHGFTGNPGAMRGVAEAFAANGFHVELPRLPGHGTTVHDMMGTTWADWTGEAEAAYQRLAARCDKVVVAGLSMGGALTVWLGTQHPEIAGLVCINAVVQPVADELLDMVQGMVDDGDTLIPGIGSDIADPDITETAYPETPTVPFLSLMAGLKEMNPTMGSITCPVFIMTSRQDHVVDPVNSDILAEAVRGPVERVHLERSYHVATLDYDKNVIETCAPAFALRVCQ